MKILKKIFHLFLVCLIVAAMLAMQKLYLDHHKDPVPAGSDVSTVSNETQKEETPSQPEKEETVTEDKTDSKQEDTKEEDGRQIYRMLDFDRRLILNVGQQDPEVCSIFCLAYGKAILDSNYSSDPYDYYDGSGAVWRWADFEDIALSDPLDVVLQRAYDEISAGRPVIFYVYGTYAYTPTEHPASRSAWQHYVLLFGYRKDADYKDLKPSDFYGADPTSGYRSNDDNYIPWVVLTDEAPNTINGEYALLAYKGDKHLPVVDAYADTVRWDADMKEEVYANKAE